MKDLLKRMVIGSPVEPLARHMYAWISLCGKYDHETLSVMDRVLKRDSHCLDVGGHKGDMLAEMIRRAPQGAHQAFEPIPASHARLVKRFPEVPIHNVALSDEAGETTFHVVVDAPALSSLRERPAAQGKRVEEIRVRTERLDAFVAPHEPIDFIKIDVEGAEYHVFRGATETLSRCHPIVVFEHGRGGADCFGAGPNQVFDLLADCGLKISLMQRWLRKQPALSKDELAEEFETNRNYYFIAYPGGE
jgi:FkbM family methyltransferase